ncbi:MAG: hypothetical protein ACE5K4_10625 [Candidatus Hydrothermarchaeota archaeon]
MVEIAEVLALAMVSTGFIFMIQTVKADKKWRWLTAGYTFLLLESIFTIVEDFVWETGFNFLEHFSAMIGCIIFAMACYTSHKKMRKIK